MKGLDTNVLLRYILHDDPDQTRIAINAIEQVEQAGRRLFIAAPVLCELIWTLRSLRFRTGRDRIVEVLEAILEAPVFEIQDRELVRRALEDYRRGPADFSDYLIGWQAQSAGCDETLTFDRALYGCERFALLEDSSRP